MQVETHVLNEIHVLRYRADNPKYALIISHGIGGHGGIYGNFCERHSALGVDVWSYDAPGHGRSTTNKPRGQFTLEEWALAGMALAEHVKATTGLPVFVLGSSLGCAAAYCTMSSDAVTGGILMGSYAIPSAPFWDKLGDPWRAESTQTLVKQLGRAMRLDISILFNFDEDYGYRGAAEQKRQDPFNTWSYDVGAFASMFTYQPPVPVSANKKPVFLAIGEKDKNLPPNLVEMFKACVAGPVETRVFKDATHQLMLFHTAEFSDAAHEFALQSI